MKPGLNLEVWPGETIDAKAAEAQAIADQLQRGVGFVFNDIRCVAVPGGNAGKLTEAQNEAQRSHFVVHSDTIKIETELEDAR